MFSTGYRKMRCCGIPRWWFRSFVNRHHPWYFNPPSFPNTTCAYAYLERGHRWGALLNLTVRICHLLMVLVQLAIDLIWLSLRRCQLLLQGGQLFFKFTFGSCTCRCIYLHIRYLSQVTYAIQTNSTLTCWKFPLLTAKADADRLCPFCGLPVQTQQKTLNSCGRWI